MRKKISTGDLIFNICNVAIMLVITVVMLYPFWNTVAVSFNDATDALKGGIYFWPRLFSTYSYQITFGKENLLIAARNSVIRTVWSTVFNVLFASIVAYVLARGEFVLKRQLTFFFVLTMYINAGLIPTYFLYKSLDFINDWKVYLIPGLLGVFNVIIIRSYMETISESLVEAARIDGAGEFRTFWQIVLPLCQPVLATVALWAAVGTWNAWFDTYIYAPRNTNLTTLQYEMMILISSAMTNSSSQVPQSGDTTSMMLNTVTPNSIRAAITVVATAPILCVYPFLQKYFVKGIQLGAVKE